MLDAPAQRKNNPLYLYRPFSLPFTRGTRPYYSSIGNFVAVSAGTSADQGALQQ